MIHSYRSATDHTQMRRKWECIQADCTRECSLELNDGVNDQDFPYVCPLGRVDEVDFEIVPIRKKKR